MPEQVVDPSNNRPELDMDNIERTLWSARAMLANNRPEDAFCALYELAHTPDVAEPHYVARINQIMGESALADQRLDLAHTYLWRALTATIDFRRYGEFNTLHVYRASIYCSFAIAASLAGHNNDVETYTSWAQRELGCVGEDPDVNDALGDLRKWLSSHAQFPDFMLDIHHINDALVCLHATLPSPGSSKAASKGEFLGYSAKTYLTPRKFRSPDTLG